MPLTLDLTPEILERLTQAAIASGISVEDYTLQVLAENVPAIAQPHPPRDRQTTIQQMHDFRTAIATRSHALSNCLSGCDNASVGLLLASPIRVFGRSRIILFDPLINLNGFPNFSSFL